MTTLFLPLLLTSVSPEPAPPVALTAHVAPMVDVFTELADEYRTAADAHREKVRAAEGLKAKRELKASHPIHEFWPRFEALAQPTVGGTCCNSSSSRIAASRRASVKLSS